MTHNFDGRKLIVIGGSSGMGRQTAVDVVRCGGHHYRRNLDLRADWSPVPLVPRVIERHHQVGIAIDPSIDGQRPECVTLTIAPVRCPCCLSGAGNRHWAVPGTTAGHRRCRARRLVHGSRLVRPPRRLRPHRRPLVADCGPGTRPGAVGTRWLTQRERGEIRSGRGASRRRRVRLEEEGSRHVVGNSRRVGAGLVCPARRRTCPEPGDGGATRTRSQPAISVSGVPLGQPTTRPEPIDSPGRTRWRSR